MTARALLATLLFLPAAHPAAAQGPDSLRVQLNGQWTVLRQADLDRLPQDTVSARIHDGPEIHFTGPQLAQVLRLVDTTAAAPRGRQLGRTVIVEASDGYRVAFGLGDLAADLTGRRILIVSRADGTALPPADGPFRLLVEGDAHPARWVRNVASLYLDPAP